MDGESLVPSPGCHGSAGGAREAEALTGRLMKGALAIAAGDPSCDVSRDPDHPGAPEYTYVSGLPGSACGLPGVVDTEFFVHETLVAAYDANGDHTDWELGPDGTTHLQVGGEVDRDGMVRFLDALLSLG